MADASKKSGDDDLEPGEVGRTRVSLSQILLAPLDALFQAQVHAARSFLNFVLQLSYPHREDRIQGEEQERLSPPLGPDTIYNVHFVHEVRLPSVGNAEPERRLQKVSLPALSLVPLRPLSVQEATFDLAMEVTWIGSHEQTRKSERRKPGAEEDPPWYLVDDPIALCGHVAPMPPDSGGTAPQMAQPHIKVNVKLGPVAVPSGLDKLLTTLTQAADVTDIGPSRN